MNKISLAMAFGLLITLAGCCCKKNTCCPKAELPLDVVVKTATIERVSGVTNVLETEDYK